MSKTILQREIPLEEVVKLLETGKTSLLDKFISKRGRPFSAYLKLEKTGKVAFEFEPRAKDAAKNGAAPAKSTRRKGSRPSARKPAVAAVKDS